MLLSYKELYTLVQDGVIRGVDVSAINPTSIDLHLGPTILHESGIKGAPRVVDLSARDSLLWSTYEMDPHDQDMDYYDLTPGRFALGHTIEKFYLPNDISAEFSLKSSLARNGLEHLLAGWIDPGFNDSVLTLELKNSTIYHTLRLRVGMPIGQVKFFRHEAVPDEHSYKARGRYNGDQSVMGIKP